MTQEGGMQEYLFSRETLNQLKRGELKTIFYIAVRENSTLGEIGIVKCRINANRDTDSLLNFLQPETGEDLLFTLIKPC